jgi:hypothetical protein
VFGHRYFGSAYFGPRYFGDGGTGDPPEPDVLSAAFLVYAWTWETWAR